MNTPVDICGEVLLEATEVPEAKERLREKLELTRESSEQAIGSGWNLTHILT